MNKSANDEALRVSFIVSIFSTPKDSWLRNAIHYVFYAYLILRCSSTSFVSTHNFDGLFLLLQLDSNIESSDPWHRILRLATSRPL